MNKPIKISLKLITSTTACIISVLLTSCIQPMKYAPINVNLVSSQAFDISTHVTGQTTYTRGTIFVTSDQKHQSIRHVQIIAWAQVDPSDDDGITYILPTEWEVTAVVTDFAKGNSNQEHYIGIDSTPGFPRTIEIGRYRGFPPLNGGQGNIRIDLELKDTKTPLPENLIFNVAAGDSNVIEYHVPFNSQATTTSISTVTSITK
jgi:hypothetical protein